MYEIVARESLGGWSSDAELEEKDGKWWFGRKLNSCFAVLEKIFWRFSHLIIFCRNLHFWIVTFDQKYWICNLQPFSGSIWAIFGHLWAAFGPFSEGNHVFFRKLIFFLNIFLRYLNDQNPQPLQKTINIISNVASNCESKNYYNDKVFLNIFDVESIIIKIQFQNEVPIDSHFQYKTFIFIEENFWKLFWK